MMEEFNFLNFGKKQQELQEDLKYQLRYFGD